MAQGPPWPSGCMRPWAPRKTLFRGCKAYGPLARVPTHRRLRYRGRRKAHYRRGWGWPLTGRGSHPLDDTQGFMTYSSIPLDRPAWPHHAPTPRLTRATIPSPATAKPSTAVADTAKLGRAPGTCNSGIALVRNNRRHGIARSRAHEVARFRRALSVAIPVLAYICRYSFEMKRNARRVRRSGVHRERFQIERRL